MYDYQGRSYLHIPQDVGVNLRSAVPPEKCYLPKKQIHVWSGHTKVSKLVVLLVVMYNSEANVKFHLLMWNIHCFRQRYREVKIEQRK